MVDINTVHILHIKYIVQEFIKEIHALLPVRISMYNIPRPPSNCDISGGHSVMYKYNQFIFCVKYII